MFDTPYQLVPYRGGSVAAPGGQGRPHPRSIPQVHNDQVTSTYPYPVHKITPQLWHPAMVNISTHGNSINMFTLENPASKRPSQRKSFLKVTMWEAVAFQPSRKTRMSGDGSTNSIQLPVTGLIFEEESRLTSHLKTEQLHVCIKWLFGASAPFYTALHTKATCEASMLSPADRSPGTQHTIVSCVTMFKFPGIPLNAQALLLLAICRVSASPLVHRSRLGLRFASAGSVPRGPESKSRCPT